MSTGSPTREVAIATSRARVQDAPRRWGADDAFALALRVEPTAMSP